MYGIFTYKTGWFCSGKCWKHIPAPWSGIVFLFSAMCKPKRLPTTYQRSNGRPRHELDEPGLQNAETTQNWSSNMRIRFFSTQCLQKPSNHLSVTFSNYIIAQLNTWQCPSRTFCCTDALWSSMARMWHTMIHFWNPLIPQCRTTHIHSQQSP